MALGATKASSGEVLTMATFNPAEMDEGGALRASKYWGTVVLSRIRPMDAGKTAKEPYGLYHEIHIQPNDSDIPLQKTKYRIGSLKDFCASKDGKTPAGPSKAHWIAFAEGRVADVTENDLISLSGEYIARMSKDGPNTKKGTNFEHLMTKIFALGVSISKASDLVGLTAFWDEFIPEGRENLNQGQGNNNTPMWILVPTELGEKKVAKKGTTTKTATTKAPPANESEEEEELEEEETESETEEAESEVEEEEENASDESNDGEKDIDDLIAEAIVAKGKTKPKNTIKVDDIPALLMTLPKARQAEAIKYWAKREELFEAGVNAELWKYNKEKGTLTIL